MTNKITNTTPATQLSSEQLLHRLATVRRCRPDILALADEWSNWRVDDYNRSAQLLIERGEAEALGLLLNAATVNSVKMAPEILSLCIKNVDNITDAAFAFAHQDEHAVEPLLATAQAEDISRERQVMSALLAAEISVKFDCPRDPVRRILWQLSREIRAINASLAIEKALYILDNENDIVPESSWLIELDLLKDLPELPPPVVIGGDTTMRRSIPKLGRNEPCHCGSGKKYKKCCYRKDQDLLRDSSGHEGLTRSELLSQPALVEDTTLIEQMRPYELKKLDPAGMNDEQLFAGYQRAELYGLRKLACAMLCELQQRPGKEEFATEHLGDLFLSALNAGDKEVIDKIKSLIPEDDLFWTEADRLRYKLIEKPDLFDDLEAICKKAASGDQEPHEFLLLDLSYAFEKTLPGMSVIFGRAAIASEPDRWFDNSILMEVIERARISVGLEPWGDPIEEYLEWTSEQIDQRFTDTTKDRKIQELQKQLAETKKRSSAAFKQLRQTERELSTLASQQQTEDRDKPEKPAGSKPVTTPIIQNSAETFSLKRKIDRLKEEIREQQADRRQWRQEAKKLRQELLSSEEKQLKAPDTIESKHNKSTIPSESKHIQLPEFTKAFRKSWEEVPRDIAARAAQAAVGFGVRDQSILQQSLPLEAKPHHYRIRIGIHYRLLLRQAPGENLQVLDIIARKNLKTWIRQHL
jgi:hypothetical protein